MADSTSMEYQPEDLLKELLPAFRISLVRGDGGPEPLLSARLLELSTILSNDINYWRLRSTFTQDLSDGNRSSPVLALLQSWEKRSPIKDLNTNLANSYPGLSALMAKRKSGAKMDDLARDINLISLENVLRDMEIVKQLVTIFTGFTSSDDVLDAEDFNSCASAAQKYCEDSGRLFDILQEDLKSCADNLQHYSQKHEIILKLSCLGATEPGSRFLVAPCTSSVEARVWLSVNCVERRPVDKLDTISICGHLGGSILDRDARLRLRQRLTEFHYHENKLWLGKTTKQDTDECVTSLIALRDALTNPGFSPGKARVLQCILAWSFAYLVNSPWCSKDYDVDTIRLSRRSGVFLPYASTALRVGIDQSSTRSALLIHQFAILLLQIECPSQMEIRMERRRIDMSADEDNMDPDLELQIWLKGTIKAFREEGHITQNFKDVVDSVLGISTLELQWRLEILRTVFAPLRDDLMQHYLDFMVGKRKWLPAQVFPMNPIALANERIGASVSPQRDTGISQGTMTRKRAGSGLEAPQTRHDPKAHFAVGSGKGHLPSALHSAPSHAYTVPEAQVAAGDTERSSAQMSKSEQWLKRFEKALDHKEVQNRSWVGLKIAILDTGLSQEAPRIDEAGARKKLKWRDFVNPEHSSSAKVHQDWSAMIDEDGHGTHCTTLLMRLLGQSFFAARNSMLFVARVARNAREFRSDAKSALRVAQAIECAATEWGVDIITMSLGFEGSVSMIQEKIEKYAGNIVFFAAASNDGGNSKEMFPAHLGNVLAVRGTNTDGAFVEAYDPSTKENRFGAPSQDIPSGWLRKEHARPLSGASTATPIAVAIAVLMIRYVTAAAIDTGNSLVQEERDMFLKQIKRRQGLIQVFRHLRGSDDSGGLYFLTPTHFFETRSQVTRLRWIGNAMEAADRD